MQLWYFILDLLSGERDDSPCVAWETSDGEFCVVDPDRLATAWGRQKRRANMTFDKLTRALRYYYERGILRKVCGKRYNYHFRFLALVNIGLQLPPYLYTSPMFLSSCLASLQDTCRLGSALYLSMLTTPARVTSCFEPLHCQPLLHSDSDCLEEARE